MAGSGDRNKPKRAIAITEIRMRAHSAAFYGTYWQLRGFREYEFVYGRKPFADFEPSLMPKINLALKKHFKDTSTHWGQGKANPATLAWVIRQVEIEVENNS